MFKKYKNYTISASNVEELSQKIEDKCNELERECIEIKDVKIINVIGGYNGTTNSNLNSIIITIKENV